MVTHALQAINSMYKWYEHSQECYVYLDDVATMLLTPTAIEGILARCEWIHRGWTLQELIAPSKILFLAADWQVIGRIWDRMHEKRLGHSRFYVSKDDTDIIDPSAMLAVLSKLTSIPQKVLTRTEHVRLQSVAAIMSWMARRATTRIEDEAYCLLGLFNINMPLLDGEGSKALERLQREIIQQRSDDSIFAWAVRPSFSLDRGLLASSTASFVDTGDVKKRLLYVREPYSMTNQGLRFEYRTDEGVLERQDSPENPYAPSIVIALNCLDAGRMAIPNCLLYLRQARCGHYIRCDYHPSEVVSRRELEGLRPQPHSGIRTYAGMSLRREARSHRLDKKRMLDSRARVIYIHVGEDHHLACQSFDLRTIDDEVGKMQDISD